ncbi:MAG: M50 family metallopeptidase [Acidimicrobiia bacterium]|nr:M50 family metallopeptidase [Acidimicrobiia bacterium]
MGGIRLGTVRGVEIVADASAAVLALLFGIVVFIHLLTDELVGSNERGLVLAVVAGVLIVLSILAHELAHAIVATRNGQQVLGIRLFMFGGYSIIEGRPSPMEEFKVAVAGPLASLGLGVLFVVAMALPVGDDVAATTRALALANVAIGLFNLFPGFPLDGGRVLRGLIAGRGTDRVVATRIVASVGRYTGWVVMALGVGLLVVRSAAGVFWLVGGWFLTSTAMATGRREELTAAFDGLTAGDVMHRLGEAVPESMYVARMIDLVGFGGDVRTQAVESNGRVVGVIGQREVDSIAPSRWGATPVSRLMVRIGPSDIVDRDEPLEMLMLREPGTSGRAIVVADDTVVGIIEPEDLGRHL